MTTQQLILSLVLATMVFSVALELKVADFTRVAQALEQRYFNTHGVLPGPDGKAARHAANQLLRRLRLSHKR